MEIRKLTEEIVQWADSVFPDRQPQSAIIKLFEEIGEMVRNPSDPGEYADICIMLFDLAHMHGVDLAQAIRAKMIVNRNRNWAKSKIGTLQHVAFEASKDYRSMAYEKGKHDFIMGQKRDASCYLHPYLNEDQISEWIDFYNRGYDLGIGDFE